MTKQFGVRIREVGVVSVLTLVLKQKEPKLMLRVKKKAYRIAQGYVRGLNLQLLPMFLAP